MAKQLPPPDTRDAYGYPVYSPSLLRTILKDPDLRNQFNDWNYQQRQQRIASNYQTAQDAAKPASTGANIANAGLQIGGVLGGQYLARNVLGFGKPINMPSWLGGPGGAAETAKTPSGGGSSLLGRLFGDSPAPSAGGDLSDLNFSTSPGVNGSMQLPFYNIGDSITSPSYGTDLASAVNAEDTSLPALSGSEGATGSGLFSDLGGLTDYLPYAGAAAGAYGLYDQFKDPGSRSATGRQALQGAGSGAALGASLGSIFPGVGTVIGGALGAGLGGVGGLISSMTASRYAPNKEGRLSVVDSLKQAGLLDDNNQAKLSSGASYSFDPTGASKDASGKFGWELKQDPVANDPVVGGANALAALITGGSNANGALTATAGELTNLSKSAGDPLLNQREIASKLGFDWKTARDKIQALPIDQSERDLYHNAIDQIFGQGAYANGQDPNAPKTQDQSSILKDQVGVAGGQPQGAVIDPNATIPSTIDNSQGTGTFAPQVTQNVTPGVQVAPAIQGLAQALSPWKTGRQIWGVS